LLSRKELSQNIPKCNGANWLHLGYTFYITERYILINLFDKFVSALIERINPL